MVDFCFAVFLHFPMRDCLKKLIAGFLVMFVLAGSFGVSLCIHADGTSHIFSGGENSPLAATQIWGADSPYDACIDIISDFNPSIDSRNFSVELPKISATTPQSISDISCKPFLRREVHQCQKTAPPKGILSLSLINTVANLIV